MRLSPRARILALVAAVAGLTSYSVAIRSSESTREPAPTVVSLDPATGAVLLDLDDDVDRDDLDRVAARLREAIEPYTWTAGLGETLSPAAQLYRIEPPASEVDDLRRLLGADADVEAVELERVWSLPEDASAYRLEPGTEADQGPSRGPFRPNDPHYRFQWHLDQIQMPEAWLRAQGDDVVVAVVDTGVSYRDADRFRRAPDLQQTRFVAGRDLVENDDLPDDEHGHGTHVAGTIAQSTNNGIGVAGVAPRAVIMPVRVLDARGAGRWGSVAAGIRWAADHGAHVINLSLGGAVSSKAISNAIVHAHSKGVVVVAAAGNTGRGRVQYPAADRFAIAVGAVRFDETLSFYSSYGSHLDVVAPGGDLRVDQNGDGRPDGVLQNTILRGDPARHDYIAYQGTSMAAPHVAGVAALLRSAGVRDPDAIERILKSTAKRKDDRNRYGAGLVMANDALVAATRNLAGARGGLALAFGGVLLWSVRRRVTRTAGMMVAAALTSGALAVAPWHLAGLEAGVGSWMPWLGAVSGLTPLLLSALPLLMLVALFYGATAIRPALAGACVGLAATQVVEALSPTLSFGWMPALLVGPWLLANAIIALGLARLVLRRE